MCENTIQLRVTIRSWDREYVWKMTYIDKTAKTSAGSLIIAIIKINWGMELGKGLPYKPEQPQNQL